MRNYGVSIIKKRWGRGTEAKGKDEALLTSHAPDCEAVALVVPILRIEVRRVEVLVVRVRGRVSMRRPVVAVRTPTVKASRVPAIDATTRKRKRFGENTGVGSGEGIFFFRAFAPSSSRLEERFFLLDISIFLTKIKKCAIIEGWE